MKNSLKKILLVIFILLALRLFSYYDGDDYMGSPRPMGMGNAFTANHDGVNSIKYNPAGLAFSKKIELMGNFGQPFFVNPTTSSFYLRQFQLAFAIPMPFAFRLKPLFEDMSFGIDAHNLWLKDDLSKLNYFEGKTSFTISKVIKDLFAPGTIIGIGSTLNLYSLILSDNQYTEANTLLNFSGARVKFGVGLDLGLLYYLNKAMIIAVAADNIITSNLALIDGVKDVPRRIIKIGFSWMIRTKDRPHLWKVFFLRYPTLAVGASIIPSNDKTKKPDITFRAGYEFWVFEKMFGFRFGAELNSFDLTTMGLNVTGGFSVHKAIGNHTIAFDLAYSYPFINSVKKSFGTPFVSLTYKAGLPKSYFIFNKEERKEMLRLEKQQKEMIKKLKEEQKLKKNKGKSSKTTINKSEKAKIDTTPIKTKKIENTKTVKDKKAVKSKKTNRNKRNIKAKEESEDKEAIDEKNSKEEEAVKDKKSNKKKKNLKNKKFSKNKNTEKK